MVLGQIPDRLPDPWLLDTEGLLSELLFESDNGERPVNAAGAVARLAAQ